MILTTDDVFTRARKFKDDLADAKQRLVAARRDREDAERAVRLAHHEERLAEEALLDLESSNAAKIYATLDVEKMASEPKRIITRVASEHGVGYRDIIGPDRRSHVVTARWAAIDAVRKAHPTYSLIKLGQVFHRDHTTILNAIRKIDAGIEPGAGNMKAAA